MIYKLDITIIVKSGRKYVGHDIISTNAGDGKGDVIDRFSNALMGRGYFTTQEDDEAWIISINEIESLKLVFHEQKA